MKLWTRFPFISYGLFRKTKLPFYVDQFQVLMDSSKNEKHKKKLLSIDYSLRINLLICFFLTIANIGSSVCYAGSYW